MIVDTLTVGSVSTANRNIFVLDCNDDDAPEPDYETVPIAQRNGDLWLWNGRYRNKRIIYPCLCTENAKTAVPQLLTLLLAQSGYQRIEDTFHTEYYKKGIFTGGTSPIYSDGGKTARFDLVFDCQPQKWLKSGEAAMSINSGAYITNPTMFPAFPLIRANWGDGGVYFAYVSPGYSTYSIVNSYTGEASTMTFDCETGDMSTRYQYITVSRNRHDGDPWNPNLQRNGRTRITFSSSVTGLTITPRWYTL